MQTLGLAMKHLMAGIALVLLTAQLSAAELIQLEETHGLYMVPVRINDAITIPFVLDSGASEISVPEDVFKTLIRARTITESDFLPPGTYVTADGSQHSEQRFVLHELRVGNQVVKDVAAGVAPDRADPLLGQSFLSRLPSWSIDNFRHTLVLNEVASPAPPPAYIPGSVPPSVNEEFNSAFALVKQGDYPAAEVALRAFIQQHPSDPLTTNAYYWLGQTFFVRNEFTEAVAAFTEGYERFPKGNRAPDNLLYLAITQSGLFVIHSYDDQRVALRKAACDRLAQLDREFPNADPRIRERAASYTKSLACWL